MIGTRVTIKDVARRSGLSTGTISRYITGNGYVSEAACKKIQAAIEELNYLPNQAARNMVSRKSGLVGVAVPEINNPFLGELMVRMEDALTQRGYSVMLCNTGFDPRKTENFIRDLVMRDAEGVILASTDLAGTGQALVGQINRTMAGVSVGQRLPQFDSINFAEFQLAQQLTEYLISMGHRQIGCIAFNKYADQTQNRRDGVVAALKQHGLPIRPEFFVGFDEEFPYRPGENGGYLCAKKLMEQPQLPTAIVAANDHYAIGAYKAVEERGLVVGQDVSIVGFDNIEMSRLVAPALTTAACDIREMAELAAELLDKRIQGKYVGESKDIVLDAQIIYRSSVKSVIDD